MTPRRAALAAALVLTATACSTGDDESGGAGGSGDDEAPASTTTTSTARVADPTCEDDTFQDRPVIVCLAGTTGDPGGQLLVVALHGRGSSAAEMRSMTRFDEATAAEGVAVVFPQGLDQGWGDDTFPTPSRPAGDEDVRYLDALVDDLRADPRIADGPVGVVGFSNGASMALRYASARPDRVRAVVSVAGQLPRDPAVRPTAPVPLLEVYGTADPLRAYDTGIPDSPGRQPGRPTPTLPTPDTVAAFVAVTPGAAAAHEDPEETDPSPDDTTRLRTERWTGTDGTRIVLHAVVDGGHVWPSSEVVFAGNGTVSSDLATTEVALAFVLDPGAG
jgi:polyhydroxybutyrate depolymerase